MANKKLGDRLRFARESAGLSLVEAARRLGFPHYQTLSKIEAGEREVKVSELSLFPKVYFCSLSSLLGNKEMRPSSRLLWRKAPQGDKKKEIEKQIFYLCELYDMLENLLDLKEEEEFRFLDASIRDIRTSLDVDTFADKTVGILGLGKRPAFSLQKILEQEYRVKFIYCSLSDIGSAATMVDAEFGAVIVINADEAPWRRNYDIAHELFHLLTWKVVSTDDLENHEYFLDIEKKADRFASTLLLPAGEVEKEINKRLQRTPLSYSDIVDIAREFGVSTVALLYRLANLKFLRWEDANNLSKSEEFLELNKQIRGKEWGDKPVPDRFYSLAIRCLRKGLISRGKFAEIVEKDRSDIDDFIKCYGLMEKEGDLIEIMAPRC